MLHLLMAGEPAITLTKGAFVDVAEVSTVVNGLGVAIPTGISCALAACFALYIKWQSRKQDKDREEHIAKWNSMMSVHEATMQNLINTHSREMERMFALYERNVTSFEGLNHKVSIWAKGKTNEY